MFTMSASRDDAWRLDRINKAVALFCCSFGISSEQAGYLIDHVEDRRGELIVTWYCAPTARQIELMLMAWRACGEKEVSHRVKPEQTEVVCILAD